MILSVSNIVTAMGRSALDTRFDICLAAIPHEVDTVPLASKRPDYHGATPQLPFLGSGQIHAGKLYARKHMPAKREKTTR